MGIMMKMNRIIFFSLLAFVAETRSFSFSPPYGKTKPRHCQRLLSSSENNGDVSSAQREQERIMETASAEGAANIRKLDVHERTKRAMLAEKVEDRIFEYTEQLEQLIETNNGIENLSREAKSEAQEIAKQTRALQIQYDDLVNGRPSLLLDLENGS